MNKSTITINGRLYDAYTGKSLHQDAPVTSPPVTSRATKSFNDIGPQRPDVQRPARRHEHQAAHAMHSRPQRATTLNRQALQKPAVPEKPAEASAAERSPLITRFRPAVIQPVPQTMSEPATPEPQQTETPPNTTPLHPSVVKALQHKPAEATHVSHSSKELKELLIKERLAEVTEKAEPKKGLLARKPRLASILVSSLALLILGGYFTYINLTNISMRVAANRAGISAEFPHYRPDGYSLNGPITYAPGEVAINYRSNTNDSGFTLTQQSSNWDSQGVLDNYVRKQTSTYLTFQQRGITVFTFNNKAAWTNGGLLYTIEGDAALSSDQILRLATSL